MQKRYSPGSRVLHLIPVVDLEAIISLLLMSADILAIGFCVDTAVKLINSLS